MRHICVGREVRVLSLRDITMPRISGQRLARHGFLQGYAWRQLQNPVGIPSVPQSLDPYPASPTRILSRRHTSFDIPMGPRKGGNAMKIDSRPTTPTIQRSFIPTWKWLSRPKRSVAAAHEHVRPLVLGFGMANGSGVAKVRVL